MGISANGSLLRTLLMGTASPFTGVGRGIGTAGKYTWGLAKGLGGAMGVGTGGIAGSLGALSGTLATGGAGVAAGLTGLITALGAITVVAGGAYLAIKKLYDLSPSGQLRSAKQYAAQKEKEAETTQKAAESLQNLQSSYQEYNAAVNEASTIEDR